MLSVTAKLEYRYHQIIKASKTRADVRLKTKAAQELEQFQALMTRLLLTIKNNTPPDFYLVLITVLERDMQENAVRLLERNATAAYDGEGRCNQETP